MGSGCELTSEHTKADPMVPLPFSGEFADKRAVIFEGGEEPGVGATGNPGSPLFRTDWRFGCGRHRPPCLWGSAPRPPDRQAGTPAATPEGERERERLGERERSAEPPASVPVGIGIGCNQTHTPIGLHRRDPIFRAQGKVWVFSASPNSACLRCKKSAA